MADSFNADEILAMKVLLARVVRGEDEKKAIGRQLETLNADLAAAEQRRATAFRAFAAFGFDLSDDDIWKNVREAMGRNAWNEGVSMGGRVVSKQEKPPEEEPPAEEIHEKSDETAEDAEAKNADPTKVDTPTIREIVLARLADAGEAGVKSADIRKFIEQTYNPPIHDKTVGMTLYRLSKDGHARRDGRTWFSARPGAEAENPGGGTPGSHEGIFD